jgi:hypothetical protein
MEHVSHRGGLLEKWRKKMRRRKQKPLERSKIDLVLWTLNSSDKKYKWDSRIAEREGIPLIFPEQFIPDVMISPPTMRDQGFIWRLSRREFSAGRNNEFIRKRIAIVISQIAYLNGFRSFTIARNDYRVMAIGRWKGKICNVSIFDPLWNVTF